MSDAVVDIEFDDIGLLFEGDMIGVFSGKAHCNQDGAVVEITFNGYCGSKDKPHTMTSWFPPGVQLSYWEQIAAELAETIADRYEQEIRDALYEFEVSNAEREFQAEPAE